MAKGSVMLQLEVKQFFSSEVMAAPSIDALVFDTLDGDVSTVREIAVQKVAHITANQNVRGLDTSSDSALAEVYLVSARGERPITLFYGPSHVPSPPVAGPEMVIMRVTDIGYTTASPGKFVFGRVVQAHAYVDETPGLPTVSSPGGIRL